MKLFFDTETTGLPDWKSPSEAEHQPHIVEIGAALLDDELNIIERYEAIIKPDGWEISEEMTAVHGISHERAMDEGVSEREALLHFTDMHDKARLRIGHNVSFDDRIIRIAIMRYLDDEAANYYREQPKLCTMLESLNIVKLPPAEAMQKRNMRGHKKPSLAEAYQFFTGEEIVNAHRAMADVEATIAVYKGILEWNKENAA